ALPPAGFVVAGRIAPVDGAAGVWIVRYRNSGLTGTAATNCSTPASKLLSRPLLKNGIKPSTSCSVIGRRNAPRARLPAMRRAHVRSGVLLSGRQTKIFRRLGVSETPVELNGPST